MRTEHIAERGLPRDVEPLLPRIIRSYLSYHGTWILLIYSGFDDWTPLVL
jgi:hypothetical protein